MTVMNCRDAKRPCSVNRQGLHKIGQTMMQPQPSKLKTIEDIIQFVEICEWVTLADCLSIVLAEKEFDIPRLYQTLNSNHYPITIQAIYRYFKQDAKAGRFPSLEFIEQFTLALSLTPKESHSLKGLWQVSQCFRKSAIGDRRKQN